MADEKKPEGKPAASSAPQADPFVEVVWDIIAILFAIYLLNAIIVAFNSGNFSILGLKITDIQKYLSSLFSKFYIFIELFGILLSVLLVYGIVYLFRKLVALRGAEAKKLYIEKVESATVNNPQWERVLNHVESTEESDWRLSILEADIILDTLLDNLRLPGDTMADKLKAVERSDFTTIDNAWEAHKIRNQIAHEPDFVLSQHEAKRVVALYQTVFEEFRII